jgi:pyruvate dehydrogenase E2 component (dihydrolipoamide acetyltransferase)
MSAALEITEVRVPDIGDFKNIPVIDVLVKPGSMVAAEDPIVTLESDKATLDVPAPRAGRVVAIEVAAGSRVSCGTLLLTLSTEAVVDGPGAVSPARTGMTPAKSDLGARNPHETGVSAPVIREPALPGPAREVPPSGVAQPPSSRGVYAGPSVRRVGRELGVDLAEVTGTGPRGRILQEDVHRWVRERIADGAAGGSPPKPLAVDFAKYGEIQRQPLSRIRRISGPALARNWSTIPHVTNFDAADITELDRFRQTLNEEKRLDAKISILSFIVKACAFALSQFPAFNASLDGEEIVLTKYIHIGVAVDTPEGLLVPVLRNADRLGVLGIAGQLSAKSALARDGKLKREDMEGGCFSISSLGGIGGDSFTPIINAPEVAILGVGKARIQPRWDGDEFVPRLILPLSLSWDHRALDGALAARFLAYLAAALQDFRRVSL